ncbi:MAG: zinc-binding dehydrogenase [Beijerinckiaceae bacterium]
MKAFINAKTEKGATLTMCNAPEPTPGDHDILIAVKAAGLNRADLARPVANPDRPEANIGGMEIAGEVIATGNMVTNFKPGDRVMSMCGKAYAEKALADSRVAMTIPANLDYVHAAAIPVFFSTAHDAIVTNGRFRAGESVLIQAVTAGVGIAMVQTAKALGASLIAVTSRDAAKLERIKPFGLGLAIVSGKDDTAALCKEATGGKGIDVIIDNIGKGVLADNMEAAAIRGRIVGVGRLGGRTDEIDLDKLALKRLKLIGVTFRTRSLDEKAEITRLMLADLGHHFASGAIAPPIDRTFPFEEALAAQDYMRTNKHVGKIVLML